MEGYIVVVCGYEGIEHIVGLFDKEQAIAKVKLLRSICGKTTDESVPWYMICVRNPEQVCVQKINAEGSECCCKELEVPIQNGWLY